VHKLKVLQSKAQYRVINNIMMLSKTILVTLLANTKTDRVIKSTVWLNIGWLKVCLMFSNNNSDHTVSKHKNEQKQTVDSVRWKNGKNVTKEKNVDFFIRKKDFRIYIYLQVVRPILRIFTSSEAGSTYV
jgi:hypothetical protein